MPNPLLHSIWNRVLLRFAVIWLLIPAVLLSGCFDDEDPVYLPYIVEIEVIGPFFENRFPNTASEINIDVPFDTEVIRIDLKTNAQPGKRAAILLNGLQVNNNQLALEAGSNLIRIEEINQGIVTKVFKLNVYRFKSAFLSGLTATDGVSTLAAAPEPFNKYSHQLTFSFPRTVDRCYLQIEKEDSLSTATVFSGEIVVSSPAESLPLAVGSNIFKIEVSSADGREKRVYEIDVVREPIRDATLHELNFSGGTLEPEFHPDTKHYDLILATEEQEISFTAALDEFATYTKSYDLNALAENSFRASAITKPLTIEVLADDKTTSLEYEITVHRNGWELVDYGPFDARDGAGIVEFNGKLWIMGGWVGTSLTSDVWVSEDGVQWEFVTHAPWEGRHCAGVVAFKNRMWVISGEGIPDVWSSPDGIIWKKELDDAPWGRRYAPMVAAFNGKLWIMGGQNMYGADVEKGIPNGMLNDVWSSSDGVNWTKMDQPPWEARGIVHGYAVLNKKLWVIGGGGKVNNATGWGLTDIWNTSDGEHWDYVADASFLSGRYHFSVTVFDNKLWVTDGSIGPQPNLSNEVWFSSDGKHWKQLRNVPFAKTHATSLLPFKDDLYLIAGYLRNEVWRFRP